MNVGGRFARPSMWAGILAACVLGAPACNRSGTATGSGAAPVRQERYAAVVFLSGSEFFNWAYESGDKMALDLDYVPMRDTVVKQVQAEWKKIQDGSGKPIAWSWLPAMRLASVSPAQVNTGSPTSSASFAVVCAP